jgi:hypothetical protein
MQKHRYNTIEIPSRGAIWMAYKPHLQPIKKEHKPDVHR